MARRLIVDTGVLVSTERQHSTFAEILDDGDDVAIAAITVAELRTGIELATEARRGPRTLFLTRVMDALPVEPYDETTAHEHGKLLAHVQRNGTKRGAHNLIIAATAVATGRVVLTGDRSARFGDLPGIECIEVG